MNRRDCKRDLPSTSPSGIHRKQTRERIETEAALLPGLAVCTLESLEATELALWLDSGSCALSDITELVALQAEVDVSLFGARGRWSCGCVVGRQVDWFKGENRMERSAFCGYGAEQWEGSKENGLG